MSRCRDGFLETEYALFEQNETLLCSRSASCREVGYLTSARNARERLRKLGVSMPLAIDAANALAPTVRRSYARGQCVCAVASRLGEGELFDAPLYDSGGYEGAWLDLRALASDCPLVGASVLLKALHLVATLDEVKGDEVVVLSTTMMMSGHGPTERSWHDVDLSRAAALPDILARVEPRASHVITRDDAALRVALLRNVQQRVATCARADRRAHLEELASCLFDDGRVDSDGSRRDAARTLLSAGQERAVGFVRRLAENRGVPHALRRKALELWLAAPVKAAPSTTGEPHSIRPRPRPRAEEIEWLEAPNAEPESLRAQHTSLARELAREYRHAYGTRLFTDALAIDAMQRHLRGKFRTWPTDEDGIREIERHVALLGEILARSLGAAWVDLESMSIPPSSIVCPYDWVRRFLTEGNREPDLVDRYLAQEASSIRL